MDPNSRAAKMALLGRKKIGREDHEKKQRRIDRLAEDWEEVGGSFNDSFQSTSSRNSNLSAKVNVSINQNQDGRNLHLERDLRSLEKELFLAGDLRLKKEEELDTPW